MVYDVNNSQSRADDKIDKSIQDKKEWLIHVDSAHCSTLIKDEYHSDFIAIKFNNKLNVVATTNAKIDKSIQEAKNKLVHVEYFK